jgi:hypothetical protein
VEADSKSNIPLDRKHSVPLDFGLKGDYDRKLQKLTGNN